MNFENSKNSHKNSHKINLKFKVNYVAFEKVQKLFF